MSLWDIVLLLVIAGACGWVGTTLMGAKRVNFIVMILVGFIGAWAGKWVTQQFHFPEPVPVSIGGTNFPLVSAMIGSILVTALVVMIRQR